MDNKIVTKPYACHNTQGGKAPICYALVPLTAVKTPVSAQRNALEKTDYTGNRIAQLKRSNSIRET